MSQAIIEAEETLIIETPERVPLAFALASIGNRFLAAAIDHTIQYLAIFLSALLFVLIAGIDFFGTGSPDQLLSDLPNWAIAVMIIVLFLLVI